ncbi:MAG: hypothetical protein WCF26_21585 [Candidatus Sulfotelmatobacter sp.]
MRHSPLVVLFVLILASNLGQAQNSSPPQSNAPSTQQSAPPKQGGRILTWTPPEQTFPPFGSQIRKAVSEIRMLCKGKDGKVRTYAGTGFIVAYHDPRLNAEQNFDYLVTNRHVAECLDDDLKPMEVQSTSFQLTNGSNGQTPILTLSERGNAHWFFPDDDSVDLAITSVAFPPDVKPFVIPMDLFFARDTLNKRSC